MANEFIVKNGLITPQFQLNGMNYPTIDGSIGQVLQTDGAGNLSFITISSSGGAASREEHLRVDYLSDNTLGTITQTTAGIASATITNPSATTGKISITFTGHINPPTSIIMYGYIRNVTPRLYVMRAIGNNLGATAEIDAGGDPSTAFGAFSGPMTLDATKTVTGAINGGLGQTATHAWVVLQFSD